MKKKCNKCGIIKDVSEFGKESRAKNGYKPRCKKCTNEYYNSKYKEFRDEKIKSSKKRYYDNKEKIKQDRKEYYNKNKEKIYKRNKEYREANKEKIRAYFRKYNKNKLINDNYYRVIRNMRSQIYNLSKGVKSQSTELLIGYSYDELINGLGRVPNNNESIDHKIPVSWFKKNTPIDIISSIYNLQILTMEENNKKSNSYCDPVDKKYHNISILYIKDKYKTKLKII